MLTVLNKTQICVVKDAFKYTQRKNMLNVKVVTEKLHNVENKLEGD